MDYFSLERLQSAFKLIFPYLGVTLRLMAVSAAFSTVLAVLIAVVRIKRIPVINTVIGIYISYMRGVPLLVQLMVVYYGLPVLINALFHINIIRWNGVIFAVIAMVLNEAAYLGEAMRGSILSVEPIQTEAGYSIGMTWWQTFRRIVLPQAVRVFIPSYGTSLAGILKSTAMLYTVGVTEIIYRAQTVAGFTGHMFEGYAVCAVFYVILCLLIKIVFHFLEKKFSYGKR